MRKTAVLFCIDSVAERAGTEAYAVELLTRLDRAAFDLHLACLQDSPHLHQLSACCSTAVFPVGSVFRPNGLRQIRRLRRYIDEQAIDIVHTWMPKATVMGVLAAKGSRCPAVVSARRNMGYWYTPFYLRLFRYLNRHTTRILANSERVREFTIQTEGIPPARVDVLYNGVDLDRYAPQRGDPRLAESLGIPPQARVVGVVANYRPVKRLDLFLRAAAIVSAAAPEAVFLLVGQGPLREGLAQLSRDLGIADKVFFSDGQGSVPDYLGRMSIGCLSSQSEGFSNAILEYMAAGLPVVATDAGGNAEAIQDRVNGYLVGTPDPQDFAAPILTLLRDEAGRAAMGRRALERCRQEFDLRDAVARQERYYLELLESGASGSRIT